MSARLQPGGKWGGGDGAGCVAAVPLEAGRGHCTALCPHSVAEPRTWVKPPSEWAGRWLQLGSHLLPEGRQEQIRRGGGEGVTISSFLSETKRKGH